MKKIVGSIICMAFSMLHMYGQGVGIGTQNPDPSAKLEISSNTQGTLITRLSTAQRNAIVSPAMGLMIFNTTTNCINIFMGSSWKQICAELDWEFIPTL